jgi:SAM-dependent methyltransferase
MTTSTKIPDNENRSVEQIKEHYQVEKELAHRLLSSTKAEREHLYTDLYDELYSRISHHPRWTRKSDPKISAWIVSQRMKLLKGYLSPEITYLEVGPGDCSLSIEVSKLVKKVYAVDVSTEVTKNQVFPENLDFVLSNGCNIPIEHNTVHIAYSHQMMEHLHPDDAQDQLKEIYNALVPGGRYICITPNRLSGPHDISKYFDEVATGFHLKEYTVTELYQLFLKVGFSKVFWIKSKDELNFKIPLSLFTVFFIQLTETLLGWLPFHLRRKIASTPFLFRGMTVMGIK